MNLRSILVLTLLVKSFHKHQCRRLTNASTFIFLKYHLKWVIYNKRNVKDYYKFVNVIYARNKIVRNSCTDKIIASNIERPSIFNWYVFPCERIKLSPTNTNSITKWVFTIAPFFHIHFKFLIFEIDDSGLKCQYSRLIIEDYKNKHVLCGYRRPFSIYMESSITYFTFYYTNVIKIPRVVLLYELIDEQFIDYFKDLKNIYSVHPLVNSFHNIISTIFEYKLQWLITTVIGYYLSIANCSNTNAKFSGDFAIYDGPYEYHYLFITKLDDSAQNISALNVSTTYYSSLSKLIVSDEFFNKQNTFSCEYSSHMHERQNIYVNTSTVLKTSNSIIHSVYELIRPKKDFSELSLNVREFSGYNEGECSLGGFIIKQYSNLLYARESIFGPFCYNASPHELFLSSTGLKSINLNNSSSTILIIYAYHPLYEIDLNIILKYSQCEGLLDPIDKCGLKQVYFVLSSYNYGCKYHKTSIGLGDYYSIILTNIKCLKIHVLRIRYVFPYIMALSAGSIVFNMKYIFKMNYLDNFNNTLFGTGKLLITDLDLKSTQLILTSKTSNIPRTKASSLDLVHFRSNSYHRSQYIITVQHINNTYQCSLKNEDYYYRGNRALFKINNECGEAIFTKPILYVIAMSTKHSFEVNELGVYNVFIVLERNSSCGIADTFSTNIDLFVSLSISFNYTRSTFEFKSSRNMFFYKIRSICNEVRFRYSILEPYLLSSVTTKDITVSVIIFSTTFSKIKITI